MGNHDTGSQFSWEGVDTVSGKLLGVSVTGLQNPTQARGPQVTHFLVLKGIHPEPQGTLVFIDSLHG